ncbi:hypothetical protein H5410_002892 [Solanum commersonii]|uniref:Uncharacterized protein n=1 Tax=Solanum commersonii TaxID=4109 RepID=A0A9J6B457_SOLCO|nr:hypothetical protein H5410_002892 [Solanum commersonii]
MCPEFFHFKKTSCARTSATRTYEFFHYSSTSFRETVATCTKRISVHGRQERKLVVLNRYNQPIGPADVVVTELGSFLGTVARNAMICPLNIHNWKNMDTKKDL